MEEFSQYLSYNNYLLTTFKKETNIDNELNTLLNENNNINNELIITFSPIIDLINKFSNAETAQIKKRKMQKADILKTHGNNYLVTKITNFKNFTKVERAIKNTSDWFRLNYKKLNFAK